MSTPTPPKKKAPAKKAAPPKPQSARREKVAAAKKAVQTSRSTGGGAPAAAATYFKERHGQKKARRAQQRERVEGARVAGEERRARARAERSARPLGESLRSLPGGRRLLLGELVLCLVIVWAGVLVAPKGDHNGTTRGMVKTSGLAALFLILALVGASGPKAQKAAGLFGGLVTLAYVVTSDDAAQVVKWAARFWSKDGTADKAPPQGGASEGTGAPIRRPATVAEGAS